MSVTQVRWQVEAHDWDGLPDEVAALVAPPVVVSAVVSVEPRRAAPAVALVRPAPPRAYRRRAARAS